MILACCFDGGLFDALIFGLIGGPALIAHLKRKFSRSAS